MDLHRRNCGEIFDNAVELLREQTVLAVAEFLNDDYMTDRYKTVDVQVKAILKFYEATNPSYNVDVDNDVESIKLICRKLKRSEARTEKVDLELLELAINLCDKVSLDVFSELQSAVTDFPNGFLDDKMMDRYDELLVQCDMLGIRSGSTSILSSNSLNDVIEYCKHCNVTHSRVKAIVENLRENYVINDNIKGEVLVALEKILDSKIEY